MATTLYHASPSANRASIRRFGLDWRRMGTERNIPGAYGAEQAGVFLARDQDEARWFVDMGRRLHGELDVWEITVEHDFDAYDPPPTVPCREVNGYLCWTQPRRVSARPPLEFWHLVTDDGLSRRACDRGRPLLAGKVLLLDEKNHFIRHLTGPREAASRPPLDGLRRVDLGDQLDEATIAAPS